MKIIKKIGSMVIALSLLLSLGINALADDKNPAQIDPTIKGSITIHKFDNTGAVVGTPASGNIITDTSNFGTPVSGIKFTITYLKDATVATTVAKAQEMIDDMKADGTLTDNQKSGVTANGAYAFTNLDQGIYLVTEEESGFITGTVAPFLVSIPMTNPANTSTWLYDVHVYPKNTVSTEAAISKTVLDEDGKPAADISADIGSDVTWQITASIPANAAAIDHTNADKGYFFVTDSLDSRLNYKSVKVELVSSAGELLSTLTPGTDYILTAPAVGTPGTNDKDIKVDFKTEEGLKRLVAAAIDDSIRITVVTTINANAITDLADPISNSASLYFNNKDGDPGDPTDPPVVTPTIPEINVSGFSIYKYGKEGDVKTALNDADFTIYATAENAAKGIALQKDTDVDWTETTGLSNIGGASIYKDGYVYFSQTDLEKVLGSVDDSTVFYLVETKAPAGYQLYNEVIQAKLGNTIEIENIKQGAGFLLPITGGSGTLLLTIIGGVLVGGACVLIFVARKKDKASTK